MRARRLLLGVKLVLPITASHGQPCAAPFEYKWSELATKVASATTTASATAPPTIAGRVEPPRRPSLDAKWVPTTISAGAPLRPSTRATAPRGRAVAGRSRRCARHASANAVATTNRNV